MPTRSRECPACHQPITEDNRGVRVYVSRRRSPKHQWLHGWKLGAPADLVCETCATTPRAGEDGAGNLVMVAGVEFTEGMDSARCQQCDVPLLLRPDKRRKITTCSDRCRSRYYTERRRTVTDRPTHACQGCGETMTGRADRRYCSPACRQRAYRRRAQLVRFGVEVEDAAAVDTFASLTAEQFEDVLRRARDDGDLSAQHVGKLAQDVLQQV